MNPWPAPSVQQKDPHQRVGRSIERKGSKASPLAKRPGPDNTGGQTSVAAGRMERAGGTGAIGTSPDVDVSWETRFQARDSATCLYDSQVPEPKWRTQGDASDNSFPSNIVFCHFSLSLHQKSNPCVNPLRLAWCLKWGTDYGESNI